MAHKVLPASPSVAAVPPGVYQRHSPRAPGAAGKRPMRQNQCLAHQEQLARAQCAKISEMTEAAEQASEKRSREVKELKEAHAKHMEALRQFNKQAIDELKQASASLKMSLMRALADGVKTSLG